MPPQIDWPKAIKPLLKKYKKEKHPLIYENNYQLLVGVVLSAQDSDKRINEVTPIFFERFPGMASLAKATPEDLLSIISTIRSNRKKTAWLIEMANIIQNDSNIPLTLDELTALPGIGRKSANVIKREAGAPAEGVIVDLHVVRVAPRLGIASGSDPKEIEKQIMETLPQKQWDAGMAMSFHGREICRPQPKCEICMMRPVCAYYNGWLSGEKIHIGSKK